MGWEGWGGRGGFRISSYYSRCHFLNFLCLCFVRVRRKKCFNVLDLRECKAFKGYRNRWSLLLNVSSLSAGAFKWLHWLQTQSRWIFHPFLKGLFFSAFFSGFLLWSTVARCCFWFWIWCGWCLLFFSTRPFLTSHKKTVVQKSSDFCQPYLFI